MKPSRLPSLLLATGLTLAFVTLAAGPVAAQGTMTPSQPPPQATGTPNQPPPGSTPPSNPPPAPPPPAGAGEPAVEPGPEGHHDAPPARTGFQIAARVGAAIPMGDAAKGAAMSDFAGPQFAAITDIGGKIIPQLFLGAYLGGNVGGIGDKTSTLLGCDKGTTGCLAVTYRIGVQAHYHIIPDGKVDPWLGYGIGYEVTRLSGTVLGQSVSATAVGPEYGHLLGGVDFRLTKIFGIGPFIDFSFGQFTHLNTEPGSKGGEIADKALHQWLTIGAKFLFFP